MHKLRDICETVFVDGAAVLMARIVDRAGVRVRRGQVARITYSIREIDLRDSERRSDVAGHIDAALDVDEVFSDSLQTGGLWDEDVVGYNFRHEIGAAGRGRFPKPGARYEIRYLFQPKSCGGPMIIQFHVRFKSR
jgi:hypothetical protein